MARDNYNKTNIERLIEIYLRNPEAIQEAPKPTMNEVVQFLSRGVRDPNSYFNKNKTEILAKQELRDSLFNRIATTVFENAGVSSDVENEFHRFSEEFGQSPNQNLSNQQASGVGKETQQK